MDIRGPVVAGTKEQLLLGREKVDSKGTKG